jgi:hypothetical protein
LICFERSDSLHKIKKIGYPKQRLARTHDDDWIDGGNVGPTRRN